MWVTQTLQQDVTPLVCVLTFGLLRAVLQLITLLSLLPLFRGLLPVNAGQIIVTIAF